MIMSNVPNMKVYQCKLCGEHDSLAPKCNKCLTQCPKCKGDSWNKGHTNCGVCFGAGAATPGSDEEAEMFFLFKKV